MQDHPRLHVEAAAPLAADGVVEITPSQSHYLNNVLRRGPGDWVRLFNARDGEWLARIESLSRRTNARVAVVSRQRPPTPEPGPILLFAPVKRDATELVVRMATELGVSALWPVLTERTNRATLRIERLAAIAVEAAEQSERLSVPAVAAPRALGSALSAWPRDQELCAAIERLDGAAIPPRSACPGGVLIGPEGGFARLELDALRGHAFVTPISLGPRILRAETAAVAALSCLQSACEQWAPSRNQPSSGGGPKTPHPPAKPAEPDVQPR